MPYLPKFRHLLLDLSQCDPARDEKDAVIRVVLELMKQVRAKELFKFVSSRGQVPLVAHVR